MGNHEFCTECHANDYHIGRSCNPEELAAVQAEKKAADKRHERQKKKAEAIVKVLAKMGIEAEIKEYCIEIPLHTLSD
jgi:hypothetical protein